MRRTEWIERSDDHLAAARLLVDAGVSGVALYLAGLSVECALKAVIARQFEAETWPKRQLVRGMYDHDLVRLRLLADLENALKRDTKDNKSLLSNWNFVDNWTVDLRYATCSLEDATDMISAVVSEPNGVRPWLAQFW